MSLTCKILETTIAKQSTAPASRITDEFKASLPKGEYAITKWEQSDGNHFKVTFEKPLKSLSGRSFQTWLVWGDVIRILKDGKPDFSKDILIKNVRYASQRDGNHSQWWRMCCSSSNYMLITSIAPDLLKQVPTDDSYLHQLNKLGYDSTNHDGHTAFLKRLGIESKWRYDMGFEDLDRSLQAGIPIVISLYHKGSLAAPAGGHCCICIGKDGDDFLFCDPWGRGFDYIDTNGEKVKYPAYPSLDRRWLTDGNKTGWGRWVTAINGKKTGL